MEYTKEELQNTYGEVQSLEHAEYIAELCESNGIELFNFYVEGITHFVINKGEVIFTYGKPAISDHDKEITIPLPPKESVVEWKEGAVCFADGQQWYSIGAHLRSSPIETASLAWALSRKDFQLNSIKRGDCIEASELDNQKYNDAVEVFELFGFNSYERKEKDALRLVNEIFFASDDLLFIGASEDCAEAERKLTYQQLMAIGELKRLDLKGGNAALSSDEETELKSRAMASELNSQSNDDEWPKVGDDAVTTSSSLVDILGIDKSTAWVRYKDKPHIYNTLHISNLSKPKTPEDILSEELAKKGVQDVYILACQIINGEFDSIKYMPKNSA